MKTALSLVMMSMISFLTPADAGKLYSYKDDKGQLHIVDSKAKIPAKYQDKSWEAGKPPKQAQEAAPVKQATKKAVAKDESYFSKAKNFLGGKSRKPTAMESQINGTLKELNTLKEKQEKRQKMLEELEHDL